MFLKLKSIMIIIVIVFIANFHVINAKASSQKQVLAGLVIRHGHIIDALQPIYSNIKNDGSLDKITYGKKYGGNGGGKTEIYKEGYVIVGLVYHKGYWMGTKRIAGLTPIMRKWKDGQPVGDMIKAGSYGLVDKISGKQLYDKIPLSGLYISKLQVSSSDLSERGFNNDGIFVSEVELTFDGKKNIEEIDIRLPIEEGIFETKDISSNSNQPIENLPFDPNDKYYTFKINIVSGTKEGQLVKGIVSFPKDSPNGKASANRFIIHYDKKCYTIQDTGVPKADINNNVINNLKVVAGPSHHRFGINGGFNRNQFRRNSEDFIRNGNEYFGYLYPNTIVDGAGKIKYQKIDNNIAEVYNNLLCKEEE